MENSKIHKIIHVDMDAFFAACEQRDFPQYKGKPIAVGGSRKRGVVAAASYEARRYGVHSAMPSALAIRKCPHLIFVNGRFDVYKEASNQIMEIFHYFTDLVEPMSLDEAYLDVTENKMNNPSATLIAKEIKKLIRQKTKLTASAGVSMNKFLAKVASDYDKPDGLFVIRPDEADRFIDQLPIGKIPGIGKATEAKMNELGIKTGADLKSVDKYILRKKFGKTGEYFFDLVRNNYFSSVSPERIRKSIGAERTFMEDIDDIDEMRENLRHIADKISGRMKAKDTMGKTITLKIKYFDFDQHTRSKTVGHLLNSREEIFQLASELLTIPIKPLKPVRLLGIQLSNLDTEPQNRISEQLTLDFYGSKAQEDIEDF
ncbi:MAG: DNA polymerase IV [Candidatus Kapaibacterium sp.]